MEKKSSDIHYKIVSILKEIGAIDKSQTNKMQNYKYRGIDDFLNALHPLLAKYEVFLNPRVLESHSEIREVTRATGKIGLDKYVTLKVEYDFVSSDGSIFTIGAVYGEAIDSSDKATNKAMSAALKYALTQMFAVPTQDNLDADSETIPIQKSVRPQAIQVKPKTEVKKTGVSIEQIKRLFTIAHQHSWADEEIKHYIQDKFNLTTTKDLSNEQYNELIKAIEGGWEHG